MKFNKFILSSVAAVGLMAGIGLSTSSCVEEIDTSNRYTFTGNTVASFLEEHEDIFSNFITILKRGGKFNLMKAYGTYTCFAPTNEAIERYLFEQDSIYWTSVKQHEADGIEGVITGKAIYTGQLDLKAALAIAAGED